MLVLFSGGRLVLNGFPSMKPAFGKAHQYELLKFLAELLAEYHRMHRKSKTD